MSIHIAIRHQLLAAFAEGPQSFGGRYYELEADVRPKPATTIPMAMTK